MLVVSLLFKLTLLLKTLSQNVPKRHSFNATNKCHPILHLNTQFFCSSSKPVTYGTLRIQFQPKVFFTLQWRLTGPAEVSQSNYQ